VSDCGHGIAIGVVVVVVCHNVADIGWSGVVVDMVSCADGGGCDSVVGVGDCGCCVVGEDDGVGAACVVVYDVVLMSLCMLDVAIDMLRLRVILVLWRVMVMILRVLSMVVLFVVVVVGMLV